MVVGSKRDVRDGEDCGMRSKLWSVEFRQGFGEDV